MARFDTVTNIIADVGTELGLGTLTASFSSTDPILLQLQALMKSVGRGLVLAYPWLQFRTDYNLTTTTATVYNLPAGFVSYVDSSAWNRTKRMPLHIVSPTQWEAMKATGITTTLPVFFRVGVEEPATGLATLELLTAPASGEAIYLEYRSRLWVRPTGATPTFLDAPAAVTDTIRFDSYLFTRALKLAWLRAKGFESTAAQQDFQVALDLVRSVNVQTAPVLSLNGGGGARLLSAANVPDTGYGA